MTKSAPSGAESADQGSARAPASTACAVVHIAGDKDYVRAKPIQPGNDAPHEAEIADVPQMHVANQRGDSSAPWLRQIRQFHGDAIHANSGAR